MKLLWCIEVLNRICPQLERLHMKMKWKENLEKLWNTFSRDLSIVRFDCDTFHIYVTNKSIEKMLHHSNFTFEMDRNSIRLWIRCQKIRNTFQINLIIISHIVDIISRAFLRKKKAWILFMVFRTQIPIENIDTTFSIFYLIESTVQILSFLFNATVILFF